MPVFLEPMGLCTADEDTVFVDKEGTLIFLGIDK